MTYHIYGANIQLKVKTMGSQSNCEVCYGNASVCFALTTIRIFVMKVPPSFIIILNDQIALLLQVLMLFVAKKFLLAAKKFYLAAKVTLSQTSAENFDIRNFIENSPGDCN